MSTSKLLRYAWRLNQADRAVRHPDRFVRNRAKSRAMSAVGIWSLWRRWWRA